MKTPAEEVGSAVSTPDPIISFQVKHVPIGDSGILGSSWHRWLRSQFGQNEVIRWKLWREAYPVLRRQTLAEHIFSICCLADEKLRAMERAGCVLDRDIIITCVREHDVGEQLLGVDVPATKKSDLDDLREYLAYREVHEPFGEPEWSRLQQAFLLQSCLKNPGCFPEDTRAIMAELARTHRQEALFFRGIEVLDYLYYAYEGWTNQGIEEILGSVSRRQMPELDKIAMELPAFGQAIWTPDVREVFAKAARDFKGLDGLPMKRQLELFEEAA